MRLSEARKIVHRVNEARKAWRKADLTRMARQNPRFPLRWIDDDHYVMNLSNWGDDYDAEVGVMVDNDDWIHKTVGRPLHGEWIADVGPGWAVVRVDWR